MIDTHSHILPGLDDGAETMEQTKQLLQTAIKEGITGIIATPHAFHPNFKTDLAVVNAQLQAVRQMAQDEGLEISIYSGQECRLIENLPELLGNGKALTMAGSQYVLLELPSSGIPAYTVPIIQQLISLGFVPVIAHAERNQGVIQKPERLKKLIQHGAMAQVTAGSLAGSFGKSIQKTALQLIDANLIHVYGSDVHNAEVRPFHYQTGIQFLEKKKRHQLIDVLLENNERIINNKGLYVLEPQDIENARWWNIFA